MSVGLSDKKLWSVHRDGHNIITRVIYSYVKIYQIFVVLNRPRALTVVKRNNNRIMYKRTSCKHNLLFQKVNTTTSGNDDDSDNNNNNNNITIICRVAIYVSPLYIYMCVYDWILCYILLCVHHHDRCSLCGSYMICLYIPVYRYITIYFIRKHEKNIYHTYHDIIGIPRMYKTTVRIDRHLVQRDILFPTRRTQLV